MTFSVTILSAFWIMMVSCDWADTFNMSLAVYFMYLLKALSHSIRHNCY